MTNRFKLRDLDSRELGTVLAALRLYQQRLDRLPDNIKMIASDDHQFKPLTDEQIDKLCEVLNCAPPREKGKEP